MQTSMTVGMNLSVCVCVDSNVCVRVFAPLRQGDNIQDAIVCVGV